MKFKPKIDDGYTEKDILGSVGEALAYDYPFVVAMGVPVREYSAHLTEFSPTVYYSDVAALKSLIVALASVVPSAEDFEEVKKLIQEVSYGDGPSETDVPDTPS